MSSRPKPVVLVILDGWGHRQSEAYNAIAQAHTPTYDALWERYPHTLIDASGPAVGLPHGQMGNSEVGHMHLGSGRKVPQDFTRINDAIKAHGFAEIPALMGAIQDAAKQDKPLHLMGLLSQGGVHSHLSHAQALVALAAAHGCRKVYVHAFLDGRDCPPKSAESDLSAIQAQLHTLGCGQIATMMGRYYAMDRDNRWDRTQTAYEALVQGAPTTATDPIAALDSAYQAGVTDEFVLPVSLLNAEGAPICIQDNDNVIFFNFRSDRARQLTHALTDAEFDAFDRRITPQIAQYVTMTEYAKNLNVTVAFPPMTLPNTLGEVLESRGLKQLRIAETEKYAHVTFFFNGGREQPFEGESRILVPSPKVSTYDLQPAMSAPEVAAKMVDAIESNTFDVIISNFANSDMVGHTGDMTAAIQAIEALDAALKLIYDAVTRVGGALLITADHGNAECMFDEATQQPHTAHTSELVPFIYVGGPPATVTTEVGTLSDVAPTLLQIMNIPQPADMTGHTLVQIKEQ